MFHSIRAKLIAAIAVIAVLLGALIFLTSMQMRGVDKVLSNLESLQDVKSHVLAPQKDMNQFIAAMDSTVLFLQLGDEASAQAAFESSVDAEQDISGEFEYLEKNAPAELKSKVEEAHLGWEVATEFLKRRAELLAEESGLTLTRPATDLKVSDEHSTSAVATAMEEYRGLSSAELSAVYANRETSPVEVSDEGIDGSEELVNELLDTERKAGSKALATSRNTVMAGSLAVMLGIVLVGAVVTTSVARPLSALKSGAEKIAGGDLDYEFKNIADDEVGSVIHSVQQMSVGLKSRIQTLQEAAGVVLLTGEEIGAEAEKAKAAGADTDAIIAKAEELKNLIGPMLG
jgi:nitrogen fixation/metabolism regulation signal transduction histidine kinase